MTADGVETASTGDRGLIEEIVRLLLAGAPPGWTQLHAEFMAPGQSAMAGASLTTSAGPQPVAVSPDVLALVAEHHRRASVAGAPWSRLIIVCGADGGLSARTEPTLQSPGSKAEATLRIWLRRALAAVSAACLLAAAGVVVWRWQWFDPPAAAMLAVPPPPSRQQAAWSAITKWIDAENRSDAAELRRSVCAHPSPMLAALIKKFEDHGNDQRLFQPDTMVKFVDNGSIVSVTITNRVRPLSDFAKSQAAQDPNGGLYIMDFTLVDEGGTLRVCDESGIGHR